MRWVDGFGSVSGVRGAVLDDSMRRRSKVDVNQRSSMQIGLPDRGCLFPLAAF
jgi:hypothetical protein